MKTETTTREENLVALDMTNRFTYIGLIKRAIDLRKMESGTGVIELEDALMTSTQSVLDGIKTQADINQVINYEDVQE